SATRRSFLPDLTRALGDVRQRLEILADLTEHYPAPRNLMSAATRAAFQQLVDLHYRRLRVELNESRQRISTLSGSVSVLPDAASAPPDLLSRAAVAGKRARVVEQLVRESLAHEDLTADEQRHINEAFGALWEAVYGPLPSQP